MKLYARIALLLTALVVGIACMCASALAAEKTGELVYDVVPTYCYANEEGTALAPEILPRIEGEGTIGAWGYINRSENKTYPRTLPTKPGKYSFYFVLANQKNEAIDALTVDMIYLGKLSDATAPTSMEFDFVGWSRRSVAYHSLSPITIAIGSPSHISSGMPFDLYTLYYPHELEGASKTESSFVSVAARDADGNPLVIEVTTDQYGYATYSTSVFNVGTYTFTLLSTEPGTFYVTDYTVKKSQLSTASSSRTIAVPRLCMSMQTFTVKKADRSVGVLNQEPVISYYDGANSVVDALEPYATGEDVPAYTCRIFDRETGLPSDGVALGDYLVEYFYPETRNYKSATAWVETSMRRVFDAPGGLAWNAEQASWEALDGAQAYRVQLYKDGAACGDPVDTTTANCDFTALIAQSGIGVYTFDVTAHKDGYLGETSAQGPHYRHTVALGVPGNPRWSSLDALTATWDGVANASGYGVRLCDETGAVLAELDADLGIAGGPCQIDLSQSIRELGCGAYRFQVCARANGFWDESPYSALGDSACFLPAPQNLEWLVGDRVTASWSSVALADGYGVQLYKDGEPLGTVVQVGTTELDLSEAMVAGGVGTYAFTVRATATGYGSVLADTSALSAGYAREALAAPTRMRLQVSSSGALLLTWDAVEHAEAYEVCLLYEDGQGICSQVTTLPVIDFEQLMQRGGSGVRILKVRALETNRYAPGAFSLLFDRPFWYTKPEGLTWDSATPGLATWDPIPNMLKYRVSLFKDGILQGQPVSTTEARYDFAGTIESLSSGEYTFRVTAVSPIDRTSLNFPSETSPAYTYRHEDTVAIRLGYNGEPYGDCLVALSGHQGDYALAQTEPGLYVGSSLPEGSYELFVDGVDTGASVLIVSSQSIERTFLFYTVTFEADGGSPAPAIAVAFGEEGAPTAVEEPTTMTRLGFRFDGWYTGPAFDYEWDFSWPVDRPVTLRAAWTPVRTVTYWTDDETFFTLECAVGDPLVLPEDPAAPSGFIFGGWSLEPGGVPATMPNEDLDILAVWIPVRTVTYWIDDVASFARDCVVGDPIVLPEDPAVPDGLVFDGWFLQSGDALPSVMPDEDLAAYAYYSAVDQLMDEAPGGEALGDETSGEVAQEPLEGVA